MWLSKTYMSLCFLGQPESSCDIELHIPTLPVLYWGQLCVSGLHT